MIQILFSCLLVAFLFVLPVPETIAMRHGLLLALLIVTLIIGLRDKKAWKNAIGSIRPYAIWHGLLMLWLIAQAVLISHESAWALKEIRGQWLPAFMCAALGVGVALLARFNSGLTRSRLLTLIVLALVAQALFSVLVTVPDFLAKGAFPQGKTAWTAGKLEISYCNNLVLAFLAVDLLSRWRYGSCLTELKTVWVVGSTGLILLSNILFGARNGIVGSLMLLLSLTLLIMWRERQALGSRRTAAFFALAMMLVGGLCVASYQTDSRWQNFEETARLAWNIEHHDTWLHPDDGGYPLTASGNEVEASAYLRISWIRAGLDLIAANPLGVGYGRNAFGHALRQTQDTRLGHAHSGIVDLTIGAGIPGLILWLGFLGWMVWHGIQRYFRRNDILGLVTVFVTAGFLGRMFLDSINRDHMLMLFFLISATLIALPDKQTAP